MRVLASLDLALEDLLQAAMRMVDHRLPQTKRTAKWAWIRFTIANSLISILSSMKMVFSSTCSHPITRLKASILLAFTLLRSFTYLDANLNAHVASGKPKRIKELRKQCWIARARKLNNRTLIKHKWIQIKESVRITMPSKKHKSLQTWRMKAKREAIVLRTTSVFIIIRRLISHPKTLSLGVMEDLLTWTTNNTMLLHIWISIVTWANSSLKWRLITPTCPWCHSSTASCQTSNKLRTSFLKTSKAVSITTISNHRIWTTKQIQKLAIQKLNLTSVKRIKQTRSRIKRTSKRLSYQREWRIRRSCPRRKSSRRRMIKSRSNSWTTPLPFNSRLMKNWKAVTTRESSSKRASQVTRNWRKKTLMWNFSKIWYNRPR